MNHTSGKRCDACGMSRTKRLAAEAAASKAWDKAWSAASEQDRKAGRPPAKSVYADLAHVARWKVLNARGIADHVRARDAGLVAKDSRKKERSNAA